MICSAPSLGSKEANDWTIAVPCALKRAHELDVSSYARTCVTRALKIDTFLARVRVSARSCNETNMDINKHAIQCNAQGLHNVC